MNMNSSRSIPAQEHGVFANWRAPHSIMPLASFEPDITHKQFFDFEPNFGAVDQSSFLSPATSNLWGVSNTAATVDSTFFPSSFAAHGHDQYYNQGFNEYIIKREVDHGCVGFYDRSLYGSSMGLNLGHRTYFSSSESSVIDRLFNRSRGFYHTNHVPRCQAEGCKADLSNAKHYHRRHKVCEFHSKAIKVIAGGVEQRFCQQCSRFHVLSEFDEVKRSCRKRLADHNRRRRKSHTSGGHDKKGSSSSSTLPLLMGKGSEVEAGKKLEVNAMDHQWMPKQEPGLSLGGFVHIDDGRSCFSPSSSTPSGTRDSSAGHLSASTATAAACLVVGSSYDQDQSHQPPSELHSLLHLGQAMFEVGEML